MPKKADLIREFVNRNYIARARSSGERSVSVRAGDVHRDMNLLQSYPAVCAALGSQKFEALYAVRRISIDGPTNGANTVFTFELL